MSQAQKVIGAVEKRIRTKKATMEQTVQQSYFLSVKITIPSEDGEVIVDCLDGSQVKVNKVKGKIFLTVV